MGIPEVTGRVIWIELNGSPKIVFRGAEVPFRLLDQGERDMSFGQRVINGQGFECGSLGFGQGLAHSVFHELGEDKVTVGQPGIGQGTVRVQGDSLVEIIDGPLHVILLTLVPEKPALEIEAISLRIRGLALADSRPGLSKQPDLQAFENLQGYVIPEVEKPLFFALEFLRPEAVAAAGIDDLEIDGDLLGGLEQRPIKDGSDGELLSDLLRPFP